MSDDVDGWAAIGELYHRYLTGLLLALVTRQGTDRAAEVVFRTFRRQHLELFLPGLRKLELDQLPPCSRVRAVPRALQRARRGQCRVDPRVRHEVVGALRAAALDLRRHRGVRHPH